MSLTKLVCPECSKVLRPAKPVEPGKKVRCPKCEAIFVAGEEEEDESNEIKVVEEEERPKKKKKAKAKAKAEPAPDKNAASGEDEEGTYSLLRDNEDEEKPEIEYAPEQTIKDLRGPAVME